MSEAAVESADVPTIASDVTSCDIIVCPSPSPRLSVCKQKKDEEWDNDSKKLEQQVSEK